MSNRKRLNDLIDMAQSQYNSENHGQVLAICALAVAIQSVADEISNTSVSLDRIESALGDASKFGE